MTVGYFSRAARSFCDTVKGTGALDFQYQPVWDVAMNQTLVQGLQSLSFSFFKQLQCSCFSYTVRVSRQCISTLLCTCSACRLYYITHRSGLWHLTSTSSMSSLFVKDKSSLHCVCTSIFYRFFLSHWQKVIPSKYEHAKSQHQLMCQQHMQQHWRTINPVPAFCKVNIVHDLLCLILNSFSLSSEPLCLTVHV